MRVPARPSRIVLSTGVPDMTVDSMRHLETPPPSELEQFDRCRSAGAFAGCDDVRAASKRLSNVAERGLRLTGVSAARFRHHIALGLSETFESAFPPTPARVLSQWASRRDEFE